MQKKKIVRFVFLGFMALGLSSPADATFYTYTGNELTTTPGVGPLGLETVGVVPNGLNHILFTMEASLGTSRPFAFFAPTSWAVSDGIHNYSSVSPPPNLNLYMQFATNALGEITEWYMQFPTFDSTDDTLLRSSNSPSVGPPGTFDEVQFCSSNSCDFSRVGDFRALVIDQPGSWSMLPSLLEPTSPIPEPTTIILLGTGIACLAGTRHKRKKS